MCAFQVSPGVQVKEYDLTTGIPGLSTTDGGAVGAFRWGPLNEVQLFGSSDEMVRRLGKPDNATASDFFTCSNFLDYGNKLRIVRVAAEATALNATAGHRTATLTSDATNPSNGDTVTIDGKVYTFQTSLTEVDGNVKIGATAALTLTNLFNAINDTGGGTPGTDYATATTAHTTVTATNPTATTVVITAIAAAAAGRVIAISENSSHLTWTGQTQLAGLLIKNDDHYTVNYAAGQGSVGLWAAKHPGALGNSLRVSFATAGSYGPRTLTGTLSSTGTAVTGVGTAFTTEVSVGDTLTDTLGNTATVATITSGTALTLVSAFASDLSGATVTASWQYKNTFRVTPGTSTYAAARGGANDEIHIIVIDSDGLWTGIAGTILEKHVGLSLASDAKSDDGTSIYYADAVNRKSNFIRWMDHLPAGTNWGSTASGTTFTSSVLPQSFTFVGGVDGNTLSDGDRIRGFDLFANAENVDVSILLAGPANNVVCTYVLNSICEVRKDCVLCLSPALADVVNNYPDEVTDSVTFRNTLPSTSYGFLDSGWKYQYDKHNDTYRWVPLNGDIGGLMVRTDKDRDPWYAFAGFNRGQIKNVVKIAYNPYQAQRDDLYLSNINPVVTFPGEGTILYGNKTLQAKSSAFDRMNVRRLFIVLEKAISRAAKYTLFEFNDEFTRSAFRNLVEPFLRDVKARRGIYDFRVVCDETNNTPEVIDRNEFVGDIYVKPARAIDFITLNFVAVRTGVEFSEIIGKF